MGKTVTETATHLIPRHAWQNGASTVPGAGASQAPATQSRAQKTPAWARANRSGITV